MKIFQLIDLIIKLFKLNKRSKVVLLFLVPTFLLGQNQAFWLGKRASGGGDPYYANVSLLLHMDGANGSTTFTDNSNNNFTITANGNAQISTAQSKFGGASGYFDGVNDYLYITNQASDNTNNVTIEFWMYPTSSSLLYRSLIDTRSNVSTNTGFGIFQYGLKIEVYGFGLKFSSANSALTINTWQHIAIVRDAGVCQIYINGIASGSSSTYSDNLTSTIIYIGTTSITLNDDYLGYLDDIRITKGIARYTSNFTPPTAPFPNN